MTQPVLQTNDEIKIVKATTDDLEKILLLFEEVLKLQGSNGYQVWNTIDKAAVEKDIQKGVQYKLTKGDEIICIFTAILHDPHIWGEKDKDGAIYLHRIVVNQQYRGQKQFEKVLTWAKQYAHKNNLDYIRMDTWAENKKIIAYYASYGFEFLGNYTTTNTTELPVQNRNQHLALLQMKIDHSAVL